MNASPLIRSSVARAANCGIPSAARPAWLTMALYLNLVLLAPGAGCSDAATATELRPAAVAVASVTVGGPAEPLMVGQTAQLTATVRDENGSVLTGKTVTWKGSSEAVATVSSTGLATGVGPGSATIIATVENRSGELALSVRASEPHPTAAGTIAYTRQNELRLIEPDGSGDRLVWAAPLVDPAKPELTYEVTAPAWRPDGSEIAFVSDHEMAISLFQKDLYAVRPDGSGVRKLTNGPAHDRLASYPKGTVTVSVSNISFNGGPFFVYVMGAREPQQIAIGVGSSARLTFTDVADLGEGVFQPVVVIDGIQRWWDAAVAADVRPGQTTDAGRLGITANPVERFGVHWPLWRADGSRVGFIVAAFSRGNPACLLQELPTNPPPVATGESLLDPEAFGPVCGADRGPALELTDPLLVVDGTSAYSETGETHIYRVAERSPTRGAPVATFNRYVRVIDLRWLPDGSGFVVSRQDDLVDEDINLYEFSFSNRSLRKLTDFTGEFVRAFSLSPDGQSIVFERVSAGSIYDLATLPADLWVVNRDGSGLRLLVKNARDPAWNPQGR